ncbi:hypothetical protein PsorP6_009771 [Peronosclerospora sorghi]|uniref:Uncharacterized protein n=1 Tax=Peronosclerospora sorghi TaxID=230839 RepID=A0ACC0W064_9STRA|nr:hypothetical protein PsorP6_009771 [Peronosclerospora sorghi]
MMKAPTAEEVLALVNAATGPDGTLDPTIQHLFMQIQEQQALNQAQAQAHDLGAVPPTVRDTPEKSVASTCGDVPPPLAPHQQPSAMKRKSIPLSMKKEAIRWIMGPGKGIPSRAEKHFGWDISASSFRKWWKNRDKILGDLGSKKRISGGGRKPYLEDSEEKMLVVLIQERAKKDRVTRKWIATTAQQMFQRSNSRFKASENWVTKFIRRNGLTLKRSCVTYEPQATSMEQPQLPSPQKLASAPSGESKTYVRSLRFSLAVYVLTMDGLDGWGVFHL